MSRFTTFGLGHVEKSKIRNLDEKVTYVFRLFNFWNFFLPKFLSFLFFSFYSSDGPSTGLLAVKKLLRKYHQDGQFLPWSSQVLWQEILVRVFRSTFWAFLCDLRLHSADHTDLGIIGKIFSSCRSRVWMMPILPKVMMSEVEERPRLVTAGYGRHSSQWVKESINMATPLIQTDFCSLLAGILLMFSAGRQLVKLVELQLVIRKSFLLMIKPGRQNDSHSQSICSVPSFKWNPSIADRINRDPLFIDSR